MKNVRNFWIETQIDGRKSLLAGGPRAKNGGFDMTIYMRDQGHVKKAVAITGFLDLDNYEGSGRLILAVDLLGEEMAFSVERSTKR